MNAIEKQAQQKSSTFTERWGVAGLSEVVRSLTAVLVAACPKPRDPSLASLRADVMVSVGKKKPVEHVLRLMLGGIEQGKSVEEVCQWMADARAFVTAYAERKARRQGAGILPFAQLHTRVAMSETREDSEADCARMLVDEDCITSLETARKERMDAVEAAEREVELLTHRIAHLRSQGR